MTSRERRHSPPLAWRPAPQAAVWQKLVAPVMVALVAGGIGWAIGELIDGGRQAAKSGIEVRHLIDSLRSQGRSQKRSDQRIGTLERTVAGVAATQKQHGKRLDAISSSLERIDTKIDRLDYRQRRGR